MITFVPGLVLAVWFATPVEGKWDFKPANPNLYLSGHVLAVTKTAIMVAPNEGKLGVTTVPFHIRLAMGSYNLLDSSGFAYTRSDVKVGDIVTLRNMKFEQILYCVSLSICQRPEGKVPPSRNYWKGEWQPYHQTIEMARAYNEKQIPIPYHLHPLTRPENFPAFDRSIPKAKRMTPFPEDRPFSYVEWMVFLR